MKKFIIFVLFVLLASAAWYLFFNQKNELLFVKSSPSENSPPPLPPAPKDIMASIKNIPIAKEATTVDIEKPKEINAVYVTGEVALAPALFERLIDLAKNSEINSMVINIKDGSSVFLNKRMTGIVRRLREEKIYPIARIVLFQDNELAASRPDLVLKNPDGSIWGKKGYSWVDPASKEVWDYNVDVSIKALDMGFEEINFDYVRFPDGNINDIVYPFYTYDRFKKDVINEAAGYINSKIKEKYSDRTISLDIFAYTFLRTYDVGVGQKLTELAPLYDVVAPMIYPSHYSAGNFGFENPAEEPYQVVLQTIRAGIAQLREKNIIIRPWLQDFNMGAIYGIEKVSAQIQAAKDALGENYSGYMMWNPNNVYEINKYLKPGDSS